MTSMKMKNRNQYKIQKSQKGVGNNAYTSRAEQAYIQNTTSYLELFMNTIKIKDFYNRYQYEMQKSCNGRGNNAYKIYMSRVEEGCIPNTISYVKLFMNTLKTKNNLCNGHQYEMQKSRNGVENNAYKIFSSWVEEGNILNAISYVKLFMTIMKVKKNFCDDTNMKYQKAGMEEEIMPIKFLQTGWSRDTFQIQYPMWNCS